MPLDLRYEVNKPEVVDESVDGEALIVHLGTGAYYSARGAGDAAWRAIAAGLTATEAVAALGMARPVFDGFLAQLVAEGLVRERSYPPVDAGELGHVAGAPELEKFTDMQDLLLLDPIHDVEETGWPSARPGVLGS